MISVTGLLCISSGKLGFLVHSYTHWRLFPLDLCPVRCFGDGRIKLVIDTSFLVESK